MYGYEYSTRIRYWISESRISDTRYSGGFGGAKSPGNGGARGGEAPGNENVGVPTRSLPHSVEAQSGLIRPPRRIPNAVRTATRSHLLPPVDTG
jgi:hypothetical protein